MSQTAYTTGDWVTITLENTTLTGRLMPQESSSFIVVKLKDGYNIGINKQKIKSITKAQLPEKKETEKKSPEKNTSKSSSKKIKAETQTKQKKKEQGEKPTVTILHVGGTIASKVDYVTGGVKPQFTSEEIIAMFPELKEFANIRSRLICNIWSQDMRFVHYNLLAKAVAEEIENGAEGIIISQGTDTLHYTSAALAFALEDLGKPVIIVGAQRSSDRGSTDAALNMTNAVFFITHTDFGEVGICMHEKSDDENCLILPATKTRKMHTSRRDAFKPINTSPWARVNYVTKQIDYYATHYGKKATRKVTVKPFKEDLKVAILKMHTHMYAEQFLFYKDYDGLVIESTGLGCLPITQKDATTAESGKIYEALKTLTQRGVIIVEAAQTIFGRIVLNVYDDQRNAQAIGILGNYSDMTAETTFLKLAWLLSNYPKTEVKKRMMENLRGELTEKSVQTAYPFTREYY
ncbi:Glu-tRNA(Gln) amidotransferase subunit GatD [Candidatus Woesearchaeota archaeon]|nr:Glu-tRNA(Gln) amidotransferase subunit GatD [Candidatus Woesearchaeota archaeon]